MKNLKPAASPGKQGVQGLAPVSGPHPQGNPADGHKVIGATHPELFSGKSAGPAPPAIAVNPGMSRDGVPGKK